jgi:hypothetical protein
MLNNLSNFWNIITGRMIKKLAEPSDLIPLGTRDSRYGGNYKPTAISFEDLLIQITPAPEIITDINTLFVSPNGLDTNPGTLENPLKTLIAAKNLSASGDLVYVLPGTYIFDNRDLKYNATVNTEVNLWKTGVSYYFSPGAIINMYNITVTGVELHLFRPTGGVYDTCNVYGSLEYNQFSQGPDTFNGASLFFYGDEIGTKLGYTFNATVKSIISTCNQPVSTSRTTIDGAAQKSIFNLTADEVSVKYVTGQTGAGCAILLRDIGFLETNVKVKKINSNFVGFYARNTNALNTIVLDVDYMQCGLELVSVAGDVSARSTYRIKQGYYNNYTNVAGAALGVSGTSAGNISLEGDFYDAVGNNTRPVMGSTATGVVTVNFSGNVYTNNISGAGRPIVLVTNANTIFKFSGTIHYLGTVATTTAMATATNGTIIMTGTAITGNMGGAMTATTNGSVTFEACRFNSAVIGSCISTTSFTVGNCSISNCLITASHTTALATVGNYTIVNSAIKNAGAGVGFINAGATGYLRLLGSTLVTTAGGALAVNYTSTAPVTTANSNSNSTITATTLNGTITTLSGINII